MHVNLETCTALYNVKRIRIRVVSIINWRFNSVSGFETELRVFYETCFCCTEEMWIRYDTGTHSANLHVMYVSSFLLVGLGFLRGLSLFYSVFHSHQCVDLWAAELRNVTALLIITGQNNWNTHMKHQCVSYFTYLIRLKDKQGLQHTRALIWHHLRQV